MGWTKKYRKKEISLIDERSFKEDSLRVLRAIQFSARFGFKIEERTLEIMKSIDLNDLTKPRILWEFEKLFMAEHLDVGFAYMYRLDIFEKLFTSKIKERDVSRVMAELKEAEFVEELRAYYFFYIVANICGFEPVDWFKKLEAPNHFLRVFKNQPFTCKPLSDIELLEIAVDMPIKDWLGNYKDSIKKQAKRLGIYETIFSGGVTIAKVIEDGFVKEDIKIEYKRRLMEKISELYT
jgi:tRNA nucleotidyltransferase (CCA-adding enzyme)